jgi:hypothetical protein
LTKTENIFPYAVGKEKFMAIAPVIPLPGDSISSQIATLYAARETARRIEQDCEEKYHKDRAELIQKFAEEVNKNPDAARIVQKQTELQTKEKQRADETKASDYMVNAINGQLNALFDRDPRGGIIALENRIKVLHCRSQEADNQAKESDSEMKELNAQLRKLRSLMNAAQAPQPSRQPQGTEQQSQTSQQPQPSQTSQQMPATQESQETRQPEARQRPRRRRK